MDVFDDTAPIYFSAGGGLDLNFGDFKLMSGGAINGGTLTLNSTFELLGGALNNTTVVGTLDLSPINASVVVHNLIAPSTPGYNLLINLTGVGSVLTFQGAQTLSDATINFSQSIPNGRTLPTLMFSAPSTGMAILTLAASTTININYSCYIDQSANPLAAIYDYGQVNIADGTEVIASADFVNFGAMTFNASSSGAIWFLSGGAVAGELINRGVITFSDSALNGVYGTGVSEFFQNEGTLSGAGQIGGFDPIQFVNSGLIEANGVNALTFDTLVTDVNSGTIEVSGQGGLVDYDTIRNTHGAIDIGNDDVVQLLGGSVINGAVTVGSNAVLQAAGGSAAPSSLYGVNITNYGQIDADDDTTLTLDGGTRVNGGLIEALEGGSLVFGAVTITGATIGIDADESLSTLAGTSTTLRNATLSAGADLVQQDGNTLNLSGYITLQNENGVAAEIQAGNADATPPSPS